MLDRKDIGKKRISTSRTSKVQGFARTGEPSQECSSYSVGARARRPISQSERKQKTKNVLWVVTGATALQKDGSVINVAEAEGFKTRCHILEAQKRSINETER